MKRISVAALSDVCGSEHGDSRPARRVARPGPDDAAFTAASGCSPRSGIMLDGFDFFIIGVANPLIAKDFATHATRSRGSCRRRRSSGRSSAPALLGPLGDRIGRRRIFKFDLVLFVVFSLLCIFAWDVWSLIAFRFVLGVAIGLDYPIAASYLAEVLPAKDRGRWLVGAFSLQAVGHPARGARRRRSSSRPSPTSTRGGSCSGFGAIPALVDHLPAPLGPREPALARAERPRGRGVRGRRVARRAPGRASPRPTAAHRAAARRGSRRSSSRSCFKPQHDPPHDLHLGAVVPDGHRRPTASGSSRRRCSPRSPSPARTRPSSPTTSPRPRARRCSTSSS